MTITPEDALWVTGALSLPTLYTILTTACDWCARVIIAIRRHK